MILTVTLNPSVDKLYSLDALRPYEVMRVREVLNSAGGKGMNVSRVAALAGEEVTAMGFVGGYNGALFESLIGNARITPRFTRVSAETRCCVNVCDETARRNTEFLEPGNPVTAAEADSFLKDYQNVLPRADVVTLSGSLPKGLPADFYAVLVRAARAAGKPVLLDTSGQALERALPAGPSFIKPNEDEIRAFVNAKTLTQSDMVAAARRMQESGVETVAVSMGKHGVLVVTSKEAYHGISPDIPVVNTVGCGDSMVAGFAIGLVRGLPIEKAIRYAVAISTASALTKETGSFCPEDLDALLPRIEVKKLP